MRSLLLKAFVCIYLVFILSSCSKNKDIEPTPVAPQYGTRLLKVYELDTTKQAPNDTISRRFFVYDNTNRLTNDSFRSSSLYPNTTYTSLRTIQYNGSDTAAFRAIRKDYTTSQLLSIDTTYYTFANGYYMGDTAVYDYGPSVPKGTSKTVYSYRPGIITRNFQNWVPQTSYSAIERDTLYQTTLNGDIVHQIDTIRTYINGQFSSAQANEITVSYLSNPNPFFYIYRGTTKNYISNSGIGNLSNSQYAPAHLISQQTISASEKLAYNYIFRADGYPLSATMTLEQNGRKSATKLVFVYATN